MHSERLNKFVRGWMTKPPCALTLVIQGVRQRRRKERKQQTSTLLAYDIWGHDTPRLGTWQPQNVSRLVPSLFQALRWWKGRKCRGRRGDWGGSAGGLGKREGGGGGHCFSSFTLSESPEKATWLQSRWNGMDFGGKRQGHQEFVRAEERDEGPSPSRTLLARVAPLKMTETSHDISVVA